MNSNYKTLSSSDLAVITALRHRLHQSPELSGEEWQTANIMADFLGGCKNVHLVTEVGGHGLAAVFGQENHDGPTVMFRAELDALPIAEKMLIPYASTNSGVSHKCGHDGHMATLAGLALNLSHTPPTKGKAVLLLQPAEETGKGALAMRHDPKLADLAPDWVFAQHNLPGYPSGTVVIRDGAFASGSCGMTITLTGKTSHAAHPEQGISPDQALAELVSSLIILPIAYQRTDNLALITIVHATLGEPAFGISPGTAEIMATFRADDNDVLYELRESAEELAATVAKNHGLKCQVGWSEEFPVTVNDCDAAAVIRRAAGKTGLPVTSGEESPFRWSEDFGILADWGKGAMFCLGAGEKHPALHAPDFDFNDDLLAPGVAMLVAITRELLS